MLGVKIDPDAPVGRLSLGEQQQVEIMRALWRGEKVLILDEPTSMLTPQGVHDLGEVMRRLREKGVALDPHHPQAGGGLCPRRPHLGPAAGPGGRRHSARAAEADEREAMRPTRSSA